MPIERGEILAKKIIDLSLVKVDPAIQIRTGLDLARVDQYTEIIREHGFMDAMDVFIDRAEIEDWKAATAEAGGLLLSDGFHRLPAYAAAGVAKGPVCIRYGNRSDALRYSMKKNGKHGAPLTNADKRRAAEIAVVDLELGNLDDKVIAQLIGVSVSLVNECRRGIKPSDKKRKSDPPPAAPPAEQQPRTESTSPTGPRETESTAPRSATARERSTPASDRPTRKNFLAQIEDHVNHDVIDEQDVVALFETKEGAYKFVPHAGGIIKLKLVGKSGRKIIEVEAVVKDIKLDGMVMKYEGPKITVEEEA